MGELESDEVGGGAERRVEIKGLSNLRDVAGVLWVRIKRTASACNSATLSATPRLSVTRPLLRSSASTIEQPSRHARPA